MKKSDFLGLLVLAVLFGIAQSKFHFSAVEGALAGIAAAASTKAISALVQSTRRKGQL
jgi:hypothetical protein